MEVVVVLGLVAIASTLGVLGYQRNWQMIHTARTQMAQDPIRNAALDPYFPLIVSAIPVNGDLNLAAAQLNTTPPIVLQSPFQFISSANLGAFNTNTLVVSSAAHISAVNRCKIPATPRVETVPIYALRFCFYIPQPLPSHMASIPVNPNYPIVVEAFLTLWDFATNTHIDQPAYAAIANPHQKGIRIVAAILSQANRDNEDRHLVRTFTKFLSVP